MTAPPIHHAGERVLCIVALYAAAFVAAGFAFDSPDRILSGLVEIVVSRDTLTTDYMGVGGIGAALVNAGLLTLMSCLVYWRAGATMNGSAVAALFLVLGFGLFGKNILNVWFIVAGVLLYAKFKRERFATHINTAFFGAALAPIFSEVAFSTYLSRPVSLPLAAATCLVIGFILAPVAARLFKAHEGYSLYNMGFTAGIIGALVVALYRSYGFVPEPVFIWTTGNNLPLAALLLTSFVSLAAVGFFLDPRALAGVGQIMKQTGQAPSDFIGTCGLGPTLVSMSLTGVISTGYVLLVRGDLNGPTLGAILSVVGFAAAGKHSRNIVPIMVGVFAGSLFKPWAAEDPSMVLAALFGTTLAPIAGRFGWHWGVIAGFIHSSAAQSVGDVHGGLVLYNNGFAAGLVAAVLTPVIVAVRRTDKVD
ncbi:DUF1576 domain-containing protein [Variovorax sp. J22P240]|uniref:DUF1576 domain-containing protein n=1 Tax=Variovorax sp. J22P240 TaxID=3053514 RepID=UPI0025791504|nr:DUF1576 domain-containing protein [Variovorax sp. J22P240]MDM0002338.1 DUF1576 domain-containing protein [Variovorax sp. J22P240]